MISVCLASYNGAQFIRQQLDSILPQLGQQDELLISDDGSSDETIAIVNTYTKDARVHLLHGPRQGVIKNVEFLISQAKGDYIFLADQDDIWKENKVSNMLMIFDTYPTVNVVVSDLTIVDESLHVLHESYFDYRQVKAGFIHNIIKNYFIGAAMAFRKELIATVLPFPKQIPMHDMWIGLVAKQNVYFLSESLVLYRRHTQNASEIQTTATVKQKMMWRYGIISALIQRLIFKK